MKIAGLWLVVLALLISCGRPGRAQGTIDPDEAAASLAASLAKLGSFGLVPTYKVNDYISAAVSLQQLGEQRACEVMRSYSVDETHQSPERQSVVYFLCRMLFVKKPLGEFRQPMMGKQALFTIQLPNDPQSKREWPLAPIDIVNGIPFCIASGYNLGGAPESGASYLDYCIKNCNWSDYKFSPRSRKYENAVLEKLLSNHENWVSRPSARDYFMQQLKPVPIDVVPKQ